MSDPLQTPDSDERPERFPPPEEPGTPATGTDDPRATRVQPVEEPDTSGTLFFTLFLLMVIFGFWALMYFELLSR